MSYNGLKGQKQSKHLQTETKIHYTANSVCQQYIFYNEASHG